MLSENKAMLQQQIQESKRNFQTDQIHEAERKMVAAGGKIGVLPGMSVSYERQKQLKMVDRAVNRMPDQYVDHPTLESGMGGPSNTGGFPIQPAAKASNEYGLELFNPNNFSINKDISAEYVRSLHGNSDQGRGGSLRTSINF